MATGNIIYQNILTTCQKHWNFWFGFCSLFWLFRQLVKFSFKFCFVCRYWFNAPFPISGALLLLLQLVSLGPNLFPRLSKSNISTLIVRSDKNVFDGGKRQLPLNLIAITNQKLNCPFYWKFRFIHNAFVQRNRNILQN